MNQSNTIPDDGKNWQWPEKTWFRQRLNALKTEENQHRRRPIVVAQRSAMVASPVTEPAEKLKSE